MAVGQREWTQAVMLVADAERLRADGVRNLQAIAWVYACSADWQAMTTRPSRARVVQRTGLSPETVKRWTRWLRERSLLGEVLRGRAAAFRPLALAIQPGQAEADSGGLASVYVLCVPERLAPATSAGPPVRAVDETDPSTSLGRKEVKDPFARASRDHAAARGPLHGHGFGDELGDLHPQDRPAARGRRGRLHTAHQVRRRVPALRSLTPRLLRHVLRPWLLPAHVDGLAWDGYTLTDLLYALDHAPDGTAHTYTTGVRHPIGWARHRLRLWLDDRQQPLPPPSARAAATAASDQAAATAGRAERERALAAVEFEATFGGQLRQIAGDRYPALRAAVLSELPGRGLLPAAAADAVTRRAIRERLAGATDPAAVAAVIDQFLSPIPGTLTT